MSCMKPEKLIQLDRSQLKHRTEDIARMDASMGKEKINWKVGEMLFEAHIRMLDDMVKYSFILSLFLSAPFAGSNLCRNAVITK